MEIHVSVSSDKVDKISKAISQTAVTLILEDMTNVREQMVNDLRQIGVTGKILEAENVQQAIEHTQKGKIDMIISDWNLPDGTGLDFLKQTKTNPTIANIPFIMCTTMDEITNIMEAIEEGATEYIVKPWEIDELADKVLDSWTRIYS